MALKPSSNTIEMASNPCCALWQEKYTEMAGRRSHLRKALKIMEDKINSLEKEQIELKKACEDQQNRADILEEEKKKEASLRTTLEDEVKALKSAKCAVNPDVDSKNKELENESVLLRTCISEKEEEIERLKQLLAEEKSLTGKGKKVSPAEKKKVAELQKNLQFEKSRADEACKIADEAKQKSEDDRFLIETLTNEVKNVTGKLEEANQMFEAEKQRLIVNSLNSEKCAVGPEVDCKYKELENEIVLLRASMAEKEVEIERVKQLLVEEKPLSGKGRKVSPSDKKKIADMQKKLKYEKSRADEACEIADAAKRKSEEDSLVIETLTNEVKNISEKLDEASRMFEAEKKLFIIEKDEEKARADEMRRIAELNEKKVADENCRATNLSMMLDEEKQKVEKLQKQLKEVMICNKSVVSSQLDELRKNLESEKEKVVSEKKRADLEKSEKEELKKVAETNMKNAMEEKRRADKLLDELHKNLEAEKEKVVSEKERADLEKYEKEEQKKVAEANMKTAMEEKGRADKLLQDLQNSSQRIESLLQELTKSEAKLKEQQSVAIENEKSLLDKLSEKLEAEKKKVVVEKKRADLEMFAKEEHKKVAEANIKKAEEEKLRADKLSEDLQGGRKRIESLEVELSEVKCMLEAERLVLAKERNHADALKSKLEEQARIAIEYEKTAMEEKCHGDNMIRELENVREKLKDVENQLCEAKQSRGLAVTCTNPPELLHNQQITLLEEQTKFEKKRVKHYKEVVQLEKERYSSSQQELHKVKRDFHCLLQQLDMLSDTFGARNHLNKKRRLNLPNLELRGSLPSSSPPRLDFCCDGEPRLSSLSSRDTSCHVKANTRLEDAGQPIESPSGMKINLDPLLGGSHGDILASSALNFNTASFSDEQLLGSQERKVDSLATPTAFGAKASDLSPTIARWNDGDRIDPVAESRINPVELDGGHAKKRRKIIDESLSIKCVHSQGDKINREAETNLFGLRNVLVQPVIEQMEKVNMPVTNHNANSCGDVDLPGKKRKSTHEPQVDFQQVEDSIVHMNMDRLISSSPPTTNRLENTQPEEGVIVDLVVSNHDGLISFEQEVDGDYMKLLDLDDADAEEYFRMALEHPLSPTLPDIDLRGFDKELDLQMLPPVCSTNNTSDLTGEYDNVPKFCVVFSDMQDIGCLSRISCATRTCISHLGLPLQTHWLMENIIRALVSEQDLIPREKVCVIFSLILLNFVWASRAKSIGFQSKENQDLLDIFSAHIQSVLLSVETRQLFANVCDLGYLRNLTEDFLLHKKVLLMTKLTSGPPHCDELNIDIMHLGKNNVLRPNLASTNMIVAGSIVLASISVAAGLVDFLCELSLKIVEMIRTNCSMTLLILHTFAYVCGKEYLMNSSYYSVMEAIKFIVASVECSLVTNENGQPGEVTWHQVFPCDRCPFAGSSIRIDVVSSKLLEEVQQCTKPENQGYTFGSRLVVVLLSLELISAHMNWDSVCDNVVSKLFEILESCDLESTMLTAIAALLGGLGRLGVKTDGYEDPGVKSIVRQLTNILHRTTTLKCNTLSMSIVQELLQLHPKGHDLVFKNNGVSAKGEQTSAIRPILNHVVPDLIA